MQASSSTQAWATAILDDCHRLALTHLHTLMEKMFESSDTAFQEFIDKAQSNASQLRFMEAMSIIDRNRTLVEEIFYKQLGKGFDEFGNLNYAAKLATAQHCEPLTLVSKEDSDIQVALQNMTSNASAGSTHVLYAIRQRLAVLNNGHKLEEDQVPAGPDSLVKAFHLAAQELVLDHETRLIVYMLFDKFVLSRTSLLYNEYNQQLLKAGLLPNLKYEVHKFPVSRQQPAGGGSGSSGAASHSGSDADTGASGAAGQSLGDELFNNILQLLSRRDRQRHGAGSSNSETAAPNSLPPAEVVSAIHRLQLKRQPDTGDLSGGGTAPGRMRRSSDLVKDMLAQLSDERDQLFTGIDRRRLPAADTQVINLVGMMFEYLLNDKNLPSVAKAELCRLHTPYLKVAIIDKSLFTNARHPAHVLLNMLADAGAKWVFENDLSRGIFPTMRMVIQRIIEEFENDVELFGELLELCRNSIHDLEHRASAIEQRTRQAAAGREKLELARTCAASAIESRVAGRNVPEALRKVLLDAWLDKLMFIYLREPESEYSTTWSLAIQTIDNIVWSVEPRTSFKAREELQEKLPNLRKKIERAFEMLDAYGASDNEAHLELIGKLQDAALQETATETPEPSATADGEPATTAEPATDEAATDTNAAARSEPETTRDPAASGVPAMQEANAPAGGINKQADAKRLSSRIRKVLAEVDKLSFGTWFTFSETDDSSPVRLKLSWYSQVSGNYMFVDSMGIKAAVKDRIELATLIANGKAGILTGDRQSFIQRALEAVRRMLSGDEKVTA